MRPSDQRPWSTFLERTWTAEEWDDRRAKHAALGEEPPLPGSERCFVNSRYHVFVTERDDGVTHLSIKRNDKEPIHDWRDLQRIKNEICGEEREAIELYPRESRLVDEANQFHLWVFPEGFDIPVGYTGERTTATPEEAAAIGAKQREWEE